MGAKITSPLLSSVQQFLAEALRNLSDHKLNFAIIHTVTAVELALKERLACLNPALVFRNIDTKIPHREQTVSLSILPQRLANLGMPLNPTQVQLINNVAEWRNRIVHHMPSFDVRSAQQKLPQLLDFLADFLRTQLGRPLETFLPRELYRVANHLLKDWQNALSAARAKATEEGNVLPDTCPACAGTAVMCLRENTAVHCHLCGAAWYRCDKCVSCGRTTFAAYQSNGSDNYCYECIEAAGEAYIQQQIDIGRGK